MEAHALQKDATAVGAALPAACEGRERRWAAATLPLVLAHLCEGGLLRADRDSEVGPLQTIGTVPLVWTRDS